MNSTMKLRQIWPVLHKNYVKMSSYSGVQAIKLPKQHEWNRAVSHAEKLVGFPTSSFHLQALMNDDVTGMTEHMRKLMGSDHPILKSLKRLVIHGGQVRQNYLHFRYICSVKNPEFCRITFKFVV